MARGRLISKSLGSSRKFHAVLEMGGRVGEFCQVLFPLIVTNTDDFGRMEGDAFTIKHVVIPSSKRPEADFERALNVLADVGLIDRYQVGDAIYLQINNFDPHQPGLHKRTSSKFPESPGISGKYRGNLRELNLTESNGTEPNRPTPLAVTDLRARFLEFWAVYPRKVKKAEAWKVWVKLHPSRELLHQMLAVLAWQRRSDDWLKDGGRFVPYPATWLNAGQWEDEPFHTPLISEKTLQQVRATEEFVKS